MALQKLRNCWWFTGAVASLSTQKPLKFQVTLKAAPKPKLLQAQISRVFENLRSVIPPVFPVFGFKEHNDFALCIDQINICKVWHGEIVTFPGLFLWGLWETCFLNVFVGQGLTWVFGCCVVLCFLIFLIFYSMVVVVNAMLCGTAETSLKMEQAVVEDHLRVNTDHGEFCFILLLIGCKLWWWFQVKLLLKWFASSTNCWWRTERMASQLARAGARKLYSFDVGGIY